MALLTPQSHVVDFNKGFADINIDIVDIKIGIADINIGIADIKIGIILTKIMAYSHKNSKNIADISSNISRISLPNP